jgi:hypothetical protein
VTGTRNYPVTASWDHEHGAKLITVVMVVMALSLAGCTTSTVRPTGVVTGVAYACSGLPPVVTGPQKVKVSLYSGSRPVASETIRSGAKYRFSVSPGAYRLVGWWRSKAVTVRAGDVATVNIMNLCR